MINYKVLIIDDEFLDRENIYSFFFSNENENYKDCPCFDYGYLQSPRNMEEKIKEYGADAILIDALLDSGDNATWRGVTVSTVLDKIKSAYQGNIPPIFLVSGKWDETLLGVVNDAFADSIPNVLPAKYYTFSFMYDMVVGCKQKDLYGNDNYYDLIKERNKIHKIIAKHKNRTNKKLHNKKEITILHISDLQYGDPKSTDSFIGLYRTMINQIKEKGIDEIDLLVISGDIAMSGKEEEYKKAKDIINLIKALWPEEKSDFSDRIILAPGNHDFDINFCVLNYFKAKNLDGKREVDRLDIIKQISGAGDKNDTQLVYNKYGTSAFRNYCYDISHNPVYLQDNNLNLVIDDFLDWGIRFIVLNSISNININETNHVDFYYDEINGLIEKIEQNNFGNKILNIVVSHHTELYIEEIGNPNKPLALFNQLKNAANCKLFLGGHRHINDKKDSETTNHNKYSVIEAASLRIDEKEDNYQRGFNVLQLFLDDNNEIHSLKENQFVFDKNDSALTLKNTIDHDF